MKATATRTEIYEAWSGYPGKEGYDINIVEDGDAEYLILTDAEADEACYNYIRESVWSFRSEFLASFTGFDEGVFEVLQSQCDDANDALLALIEASNGIYNFVAEAVDCDGRGQFLSTYDGEEVEFEYQGVMYYIYRIN